MNHSYVIINSVDTDDNVYENNNKNICINIYSLLKKIISTILFIVLVSFIPALCITMLILNK